MSNELFNPEAFEQIKGQTALDTDWCEQAACPADQCVECQRTRTWKRDESLVFTPHGETDERSGQFWSDETVGVIVYGWEDGRKYLVAHDAIRGETPDEREDREQRGVYVEARQWANSYGERIVEASLADQGLETARSFYVHRVGPDGHEGWTGSLRSFSRATREMQAWRDSGWTAEVVPNTPETRAKVRRWQKRSRRHIDRVQRGYTR